MGSSYRHRIIDHVLGRDRCQLLLSSRKHQYYLEVFAITQYSLRVSRYEVYNISVRISLHLVDVLQEDIMAVIIEGEKEMIEYLSSIPSKTCR